MYIASDYFVMHSVVLFVHVQWVYSDRPRDRGGRPISDVIDIDADHDEGQFEVDGSGDGADDEDDVQSGDGDELDASGAVSYTHLTLPTKRIV